MTNISDVFTKEALEKISLMIDEKEMKSFNRGWY